MMFVIIPLNVEMKQIQRVFIIVMKQKKGFIQQAILAQTKYVLDNGNDLEEAITSYGSGSINFSKNKKEV